MGKILLRLNVALLGHPAGSTIEIPAKEDGSPAELFWRRRLRDSARDGCVEVVSPKVPKSKTASAAGGE